MLTLEDFGELMLGTRLKRLSDRMYNEVDQLYKDRDIQVSSRCFAPLITLLNNGHLSVSELAGLLGQSHAAVSQVSKILLKEGLIEQTKDPKDERKRVLSVSTQGQLLAIKVKDIWQDLTWAVREVLQQVNVDLLEDLKAIEDGLAEKGLVERVNERRSLRDHIEIIPYEPRFKESFKTLNEEWLEKYFYVEEIDHRVISTPEESILAPGGYIFFAKITQDKQDHIIGTAALIHAGNDQYELSKMSVTEAYQGMGIGKKLAERAIEHYKSLAANKLFLESNSRLKPALRLYESLGFRHKAPLEGSHYKRADVYMVFEENKPS